MHINPREVVAARLRLGLTQEDLAEKVGISRTALSNIETGQTDRPRPYALRALADALGVTVDDITTDIRAAS